MEPYFKDDSEITGNGSFDLPFNFQYSYNVLRQDTEELSTFNRNKKTKSLCDPNTRTCKPFNLIYDAQVVGNSKISIEIETQLNDFNKALIGGFNVIVSNYLVNLI